MDGIDFSAHAYLIRSESGIADFLTSLEERGIKTAGNPDCFLREFESFSVEDARAVSSFAYFKPVGERKYIVISAQSMTVEAQNALLKIVEEGSGSSVFFFVLPGGVPVVPTLESRCITIKTIDNKQKTKDGEEFLKMSYKGRLEVAEKFAKDHDREGARQLVRSLLAAAGNPQANVPRISVEKLRDLLDADRYLQLSGSSPKIIIGHLALTL